MAGPDPFSVLAAVSQADVEDACGESAGWACRETLQATRSEEMALAAEFLVGKPLSILAIVAGALIVNRLARRAVKRGLRGLHSGPVKERLGAVRRRTPNALLETEEISLRATQRIEALATVLRSVVSVIIAGVALLLVLGEIGIDLAPLLAGAGILGVALGFGSQSLVKDFLSGLFILVEDQFGVGDVVNLDQEVSGVVEAVSLRTTRLRAVDGTVWHMPNGEIRRVGNKSQLWSRALLDIDVGYDTDVDHASAVIKAEADAVWKEHDEVIEEPELWGVENLGPSGVRIRLVLKTRPSEQWAISRELRQRIKAAFDREGIEIPVWYAQGAPGGPAGASARSAGESAPTGRPA
ncbi:MAG: mechanosensitive ion channel family protein [Actinomycetota bacterium]|nr:mechanosensitive ion channel family protein [Actinomycetota bacterium]